MTTAKRRVPSERGGMMRETRERPTNRTSAGNAAAPVGGTRGVDPIDTLNAAGTSERATPHPPSKVMLTLGLIAVVAILIFLLTRLLVATNPAPHLSGTAGSTAPNFTMPVWNAANGSSGAQANTLSLASLHGRPVVLFFWNASNLQSQQIAQSYEDLSKQYAMFNVVFVGIAVHTDQSSGQAFIKQYGLTFPNGPDTTGAIGKAYAIPGTPTAVFITSGGTVAETLVGENTPDEIDYLIRMDLLGGVPPLGTPGS